jgi:hypothetical protein
MGCYHRMHCKALLEAKPSELRAFNCACICIYDGRTILMTIRDVQVRLSQASMLADV